MPNQRSEQPTQRDHIISYIDEHPNCRASDICEAVNVQPYRMSVELATLKKLGRVVSVKMEGDRQHLYSIALRHRSPKCDKRLVIMVKEWTGHKRDDWTTLFYGEAA